MNDIIPLEQEVDRLFQFALERTSNLETLASFHRLLQQCRQRLEQPMRVAIVGIIKAGKSTMMNALLGEAIVATGSVEATFNVNWLKYGDRTNLKVHFKDSQRSPEEKSFSELAALTLRAEENYDYLLSIKHIEVSYPNKILQTFNIIDTPGLKSFYKDDAQNTQDFLQLHGEELSDVTQQQAANADAILYLFSQSLGNAGREIIEQFQGQLAGNATPINAIGVLTKVDFYWPDKSDPMAAGSKIARRLAQTPEIRRLLYTIYPVCGLLGVGSQTLTSDQFDMLQELAQLPEEKFEDLICSVRRFNRDYPDISLPGAKRKHLLNHLGQYGVWLAYSLIRSGINEREQLAKELLKRSGLEELRQLIISHFGHRAFLIKLGTVLRQISVAYFQQRKGLQGTSLQVLEEVTGKFEALKDKQHAFQELDVLRSYYENKLDFDPEETEQLLQVTGEYGTSCGERLGLGERAIVEEMLPVAEARMRYWNQRADDFFTSDRATIAAAKVLARSYGRILYRVQKAKEYLYI